MLKVAEMPAQERPREKFFHRGAATLSMEELLAILLRTGYKGKSVIAVARDIIDTLVGGEGGIANATPRQLMKIKGIGKDKAVTVCAALELGRRLSQLKVKQTYSDFSQPEAVAKYVMERMRHLQEEHFVVALLNTKNELITIVTISTGGLTASMAEQRSVFRNAIDANAASIILIHNHPSGTPTPSKEDVRATHVFIEAGRIMGIPVLDHIIIGDGVYVSLCEEDYI